MNGGEASSCSFSCLPGITLDGDGGEPEDGLDWGGCWGRSVGICLTWKSVQIAYTHLHSCFFASPALLPPCPSTFMPPRSAVSRRQVWHWDQNYSSWSHFILTRASKARLGGDDLPPLQLGTFELQGVVSKFTQ